MTTPETELRPRPRRRRFTILDVVILVAAGACGLRPHLLLIEFLGTRGIGTARSMVGKFLEGNPFRTPYYVLYWFYIGAPWLIVASLALLALRLVPPRPRRSRRARQPGSLAILAASTGAGVVALAWCLLAWPLRRQGMLAASNTLTDQLVGYKMMLAASLAACAAVAAAWLALWFGGRKARETDWVEWAGRVLGALWIASAPFYLWAFLLN